MSNMKIPTINGGIDHIHLYTKDRAATAKWYQETLGFEVAVEFSQWAKNSSGPLTIRNREDTIHLAIFEREVAKPFSIAFGVTAAEYIAWKEYMETASIAIRESDHALSWSIYFTDPAGNELEITSYDYAIISAHNQSTAKITTDA